MSDIGTEEHGGRVLHGLQAVIFDDSIDTSQLHVDSTTSELSIIYCRPTSSQALLEREVVTILVKAALVRDFLVDLEVTVC
jgi:hypothetical protein